MEAHLLNWLELLLRWGHFIAGVAWIGASFYFNWLENHLHRSVGHEDIEGDLWAIHGGGFYYLKKYALAPETLPARLHWFKWEAYATWLSGLSLLCLLYYWNARAFMINPAVADISTTTAVAVGILSMAISWVVYDRLCCSRLSKHHSWLNACLLAWFLILAWTLGQLLSGRAAYIHVGAALGTIMAANVFRIIIPAQKELVKAVTEERQPDPGKGRLALQRSRHNNYLTLPVLFIMVSSHYPATYGHANGWLVLLLVSLAGLLVRHFFNIRHLEGNKAWPLAAAGLLITGLVIATAPKPVRTTETNTGPQATAGQAFSIIQRRCVTCHARKPSNQAFSNPPLGIELDSMDGLRLNAEGIYRSAVITRTMPLGNLTHMTEEERATLANWFENSPHNPAR